MSAAQIERIQEHLQRLRLFKSRERLEAVLQEASTQELSYADFLDQVLTEEVTAKTAKHVTMRTSLARFPFVKSLEAFEFGYQPSVDRKQIQTLSTCRFVEHGENVVLLGPPGVGKTRLAVGLGLKAIEHGYRVLFTTAAAMLTTLSRAHSDGRLDDKLKVFTVPRVLIIDELPAHRQPRGQSLFPVDQPPVRTRADDPHQQSELWQLGRCLRRSGHRIGDSRPRAPSLHHGQHQRRQLPAPGETESRPAEIEAHTGGPDDERLNGTRRPQVGRFR
jgi:DNA replication protein DnaC